MVRGIDIYGGISYNTGRLHLVSDGSYTFYPSSSFAGSCNVIYRVCDGHTPSLCRYANLKINIEPIPNGMANQNPFADDDIVLMKSDQVYN
jgi:hypothetical protein